MKKQLLMKILFRMFQMNWLTTKKEGDYHVIFLQNEKFKSKLAGPNYKSKKLRELLRDEN